MVNMFLKNKKGQGMSTSTIILLILGLIVLVALVWGFATGWSSIKNLVNPTNVDTVVQDCSSACALGANGQYSYCSAQRTLNVNEDHLNVKSSCLVFANEKAFSKYKIPACPTINCNLNCSEVVINGRKGNSALTSGKYDLTNLVNQNCFIN